MEIIKITWQGFVGKNGESPERCNKTYLNIERALLKFEPLFAIFGVKVVLEKKALSEEEFKRDPLSSNRVFINGEPIENILNLGKNTNCGAIQDLKCRIDGDEETNEIPEKHIVTALFTKIKERF